MSCRGNLPQVSNIANSDLCKRAGGAWDPQPPTASIEGKCWPPKAFMGPVGFTFFDANPAFCGLPNARPLQ